LDLVRAKGLIAADLLDYPVGAFEVAAIEAVRFRQLRGKKKAVAAC